MNKYTRASPASVQHSMNDVMHVVMRAEESYAPFNSAHEAYAALLEQMDALKAHVWTKESARDIDAMTSKAKHVAATAVRFLRDVCEDESMARSLIDQRVRQSIAEARYVGVSKPKQPSP